MRDKHTPAVGVTSSSPIDRLRRDLAAFGRPGAGNTPATDRLTEELGHDLYAAVLAELNRPNAGGFPLSSRSRRVA